jgi:hypothetical protein
MTSIEMLYKIDYHFVQHFNRRHTISSDSKCSYTVYTCRSKCISISVKKDGRTLIVCVIQSHNTSNSMTFIEMLYKIDNHFVKHFHFVQHLVKNIFNVAFIYSIHIQK